MAADRTKVKRHQKQPSAYAHRMPAGSRRENDIVIKVDIDFRNATQTEIDTFYGIPGLQAALSELQTNNRRYNAVLTVHEPGNQLVEVKVLLMEFMRKHNMKSGHAIPQKPFMFTFVPSLNPVQKELLESVVATLVNEGTLTDDGGSLRLTEVGYQALY